MRRGGAAVLLVTAMVGLLALAIEAASDKRDLAFTIGVVPTIVAADLRPGATVCQAPIDVSDDFSRVRLRTGGGGAGQPLVVSILAMPSGRQLAQGRVRSGSGDATDRAASVGTVDAEQKIGVCVRNAGTRPVSLYGNTLAGAPLSGAILGKRQLKTDLSVVFLHGDSRSMLAQLPRVFERASVFRPGFVGPWLFWVLGAAVLFGVPVLLARALADTDEATRAP
jgi:hypothetical protein